MPERKNKRIFLAFPLYENYKSFCQEFIDLQDAHNIRWINKDNWHITALFIGDFPVDKLESLQQELRLALSEIHPFELIFDGFHYQYKGNNPVMIWGKFQQNNAFDNIIKLFAEVYTRFCEFNHIPFSLKLHPESIPHITLSRLKYGSFPKLRKPNPTPDPLIIEKVLLFESILKPEGAEYHILDLFKLG